jgi:probable F420-dependent oxidoreductase
MRAFRFGLQIGHATATAEDLRALARAAEDVGFDVMHTWDHVVDGWSPLAPLLAIADCTTRLRICPLVLNNDFFHPVHLARELASIDQLTAGRLEVGLGAGHSFTEYAAIGLHFDPPQVRKARLAEAVEILRGLLSGDEVTYTGEHFQLQNVRTMRAHQERVPFLIGVNGHQALDHAARYADTIGLTMLGRTLEDGQRHEVRWQLDRLDRTVAYIRERAPQVELNALVQRVLITEDREGALRELVGQIPGLSLADAFETPFLAIGTPDEIAAQLRMCRERWGISYFSVRDLEAFAPVIERMRAEPPHRGSFR